jgi:hypothetical protein
MAENENQEAGANQEAEASTQENQEGEKSRSQESILAEMNRKYNKISEENSRMSQMLEQLAARQQQPVQQVNQQTDDAKELADLVYSNPAEYARRVTEKATKQATQAVQHTLTQQQQTNTVLTQLASEYPELSDNSSELTTKAVNIYKQMSPEERLSPSAYKIAVRDAAADLGLLPKARRAKASNNEPNIGNSNNAVNDIAKGQQRAAAKNTSKASERTLAFAELMGLDVSKKEVIENLNKRTQEVAIKRRSSN